MLQLDADEDGQPLFKPSAQPSNAGGDGSGTKPVEATEAHTTAAATATAEQED